MDSRFHGNDIRGIGNDISGIMGLPRRYAPRNDRGMDSRLRGNDISGMAFGEFYIFFIILQRPIIYLMYSNTIFYKLSIIFYLFMII